MTKSPMNALFFEQKPPFICLKQLRRAWQLNDSVRAAIFMSQVRYYGSVLEIDPLNPTGHAGQDFVRNRIEHLC